MDQEHLTIDAQKNASAAVTVTRQCEHRAAELAGTANRAFISDPVGGNRAQPRGRLLLAPGVVAGTELWGQLASRADSQPG